MTVYIAHYCGKCNRKQKLLVNGTFSSHKNKEGERCSGSGMWPEDTFLPELETITSINMSHRPWWKFWIRGQNGTG